MRTLSLRLFVSACAFAGLSVPGRALEPPRAFQPAPISSFQDFPCPPDPCPPVACPPLCPVPCPPARPPRVRVIMSPPEVVFEQACVAQKGARRLFPCSPPCGPTCPSGAPLGTPDKPVGAPEKPQGAPAQAVGAQVQQAFQTVPVTTFHSVPVTTYQTVPVTTFQTVPVSASATFAAQGVGVQNFGVQGFGVQGFGAQMGFGAPMGFGAQGAGASADFELRLIQALSAIAQQNKGAAPCNKAGAQGAAPDELTKQFLDLEKRLDALTGEVVYNRKMIVDHEGRIKKLEDAAKEPKEPNKQSAVPPSAPLPSAALPSAPSLPSIPNIR